MEFQTSSDSSVVTSTPRMKSEVGRRMILRHFVSNFQNISLMAKVEKSPEKKTQLSMKQSDTPKLQLYNKISKRIKESPEEKHQLMSVKDRSDAPELQSNKDISLVTRKSAQMELQLFNKEQKDTPKMQFQSKSTSPKIQLHPKFLFNHQPSTPLYEIEKFNKIFDKAPKTRPKQTHRRIRF